MGKSESLVSSKRNHLFMIFAIFVIAYSFISCKEEEGENIALLVEGSYDGYYVIDETDTTYDVTVLISRLANDRIKVEAVNNSDIFSPFETGLLVNLGSIITSDISSGVSLATDVAVTPAILGFSIYDTGEEFRGTKN